MPHNKRIKKKEGYGLSPLIGTDVFMNSQTDIGLSKWK